MLLSSTSLGIVFNITKLFSSRDGGGFDTFVYSDIQVQKTLLQKGIRENEKKRGAMSLADFRKFPFVRKPSATRKPMQLNTIESGTIFSKLLRTSL